MVLRMLALVVTILGVLVGTRTGAEPPYLIRNSDGEIRWVQGKNYYEVTEEHVTPHIPWAKPLAEGPVRALFISPRACHRETVELAQRLQLDYEIIMMPGKPDEFAPENQFKFLHLDPEDVTREYQEKLAKDWDVILLANCQWDCFPPEYEEILLHKLEGGTGIVLTYQWKVESSRLTGILNGSRDSVAEGRIAGSIPTSRIPGLKPDGGEELVVDCLEAGAGRLVRLKYPKELKSWQTLNSLTPIPPEDRVLPDVLYDYYHSLVAKAVVWAARKESGVRIGSFQVSGPLAKGERTISLDITCDDSRLATLSAVARDWWGTQRASTSLEINLDKGIANREIALPRLPSGTHFVDVWVRDREGKVLDWGSSIVDATSVATISSIELDRRSYPAGSTISGRAFVAGNPPEGSSIRIELLDSLGRLLARHENSFEGEPVSFSFDFTQPVAIQHEIVASLFDEKGLLHQDRKLFAVSGLVYDDFAFVVWGSEGQNRYRDRLIARASYELGVDSSYGRGKPLDWLENPIAYWTTRAGLSQFFYGTYLGGLPDEDHIRSRCLSDPQVRKSHAKELSELAKENKHLGGIGYSTGDEYRLSDQGKDLCWSEHCLARLRRHLEEKYLTVEALNKDWRTDFNSFNEVVPDTIEQAHKRGHYTAWAENRRFSEFVYADIHNHLRKVVESVHEGPPVGEEGMFDSDTYFGVDWERFRHAATLIHGYERPQQQEKIRSLAPKTAMTGYWVGYYNRDYSEERMRWHPWHSLLTGFNSAWWWTAAMICSDQTWPLGFASDLTPQDPFKWTAEEVREIKRGIGKLILNAERLHDGIAILYSMHSNRAADAHHELTVPLGSSHYEGTIKSSELAWCLLLEDLGMQYEFVSHRDVAQGELLEGEFSVLVLPTSASLTEGEANAIRAFVRNGGTVIADLWPGIMDEWGNVLSLGQLDDAFGIAQSGLVDLQIVDVEWNEKANQKLPNRHSNPAVELRGAMARATVDGISVMTENLFQQGRCCCLHFSINDYFSDWHSADEHSDLRWRPEGKVLRSYVAGLLGDAGVPAPISVKMEDGEPLVGCEAVFFERGNLRYLGLQSVADNLYFHMGDEGWLFDHYELQPDCSPVPITVSLPKKDHVYNMREGQYLGQVAEFETKIKPGQALMFALLPYEVGTLSLEGPEEPLRIEKEDGRNETIKPQRFHARLDAGPEKMGMHCFRVDVFDPVGNEVHEYGQNVLARSGRATFTIPFALDDPHGDWRILVQDVASGTKAKQRICFSCP